MEKYLLIVVVLLGLIIVACSSGGTTEGIQVLPPAEFKAAYDQATNPILLDVRTMEEVQKGAIKNAMVIDYYQDGFKEKVDKLDREKPIFVYCAAGGRSNKCANMMKEMGFKDIYDLKGGYGAWAKDKP